MSPWEGRLPGADGVTLRVRIDDAQAGARAPTALIVNGLMMSIEAWTALADDLVADHRLVRFDQRGQGQSDDPDAPHRIEDHAADLVALVRRLEADHGLGRFHLLGLSSGVPAAILAAAALEAERPGRVASLAACDGFVRMDTHLTLVVRAWLAAHEVGGPLHRFDIATPWVWGQAFLRDHQDALADWRAAAAGADPTRAFHLIGGMAAYDADAGPALATLPCPVLALHGEDDVMTPARHGRALLEHARDGRLVLVPEAGHASPLERPAAVAAALRAFWQDADAGAASTAHGEDRP